MIDRKILDILIKYWFLSYTETTLKQLCIYIFSDRLSEILAFIGNSYRFLWIVSLPLG
jgi:hypothetical protein